MYSRKVKTGVFVLEGINALSTVYYFSYFYFFLQDRFGFGNRQNLLVAGFTGGIYMIAAALGGRYGQRKGYFNALMLGYTLMTASQLASAFVSTLPAYLLLFGTCTVGMCLTWPNLEAMVSEQEPPLRLQRMVGIYNLIWSLCMALSFFTGGALKDWLGYQSIFLLPVGLNILQIIIAWQLARRAALPKESVPEPATVVFTRPELNPRPIARAKTFLKLAWLANPLAYITVNSTIPTLPTLAKKFSFSPTMAGVFCSLWLFARCGAFVGLWLWTGWHYHFNYLVSAYLGMIVSFVTVLLVPNLTVLLLAQVLFGVSLGVIYYSSLFYSMDTSDTKGEHGGWHEAAIGAGNCAGPLLSATALYLLPNFAAAGVWTVVFVLLIGLGGLVTIYRKGHVVSTT